MYPVPSFAWHAISPDTFGSSICWHKCSLVMKATGYSFLMIIFSLIGFSRLWCCCCISITRIGTTRASGMSHIQHEAVEWIESTHAWRSKNVCTKRSNEWWVRLFYMVNRTQRKQNKEIHTHSPCMCSGGCFSLVIPDRKEQEFFSSSEAFANLGQKSDTILHTVPCTSFSFVPTSLFSPQVVWKGSNACQCMWIKLMNKRRTKRQLNAYSFSPVNTNTLMPRCSNRMKDMDTFGLLWPGHLLRWYGVIHILHTLQARMISQR